MLGVSNAISKRQINKKSKNWHEQRFDNIEFATSVSVFLQETLMVGNS